MHFISKISNEVELIQLTSDNQVLFSVAPAHGARLTELVFKAGMEYHSVLWETTPNDCITGAWSKNEILFPFPNRIEDGKYEYEGISYQLPINEVENNNALHGMVANAKFDVVEQNASDSEGHITLRHKYDGSKKYYPFPFMLEVTYKYDFKGFDVLFVVKNTGKSTLPFGLGWHPYFKLGKDGLMGVKLTIPETDHLLLGKRNLPTGEIQNFNYSELELSDWNLDDCFRLKQSEVSYELWNEYIKLFMSGSEEFRYLQLFTPEGCGTVAIEPMTSGVNVFNNKEGLRYLKASDSFQVSFKISC